jgi:hypothetical protein
MKDLNPIELFQYVSPNWAASFVNSPVLTTAMVMLVGITHLVRHLVSHHSVGCH